MHVQNMHKISHNNTKGGNCMRSTNIAILAQLCGNEGFSAYENTRTRNELCIIVENNLDVLTQIMSNFLIEE